MNEAAKETGRVAPALGAPLAGSQPAAGRNVNPLWRAASFTVLLYAVWMTVLGLFHPHLGWFSAPGFDARPLLLYLCLDGLALGLSAAYHCGLDGRRYQTLGLGFSPGWLRHATAGLAWGAGVISGTVLLLVVFRAASLATARAMPSVHDVSLVVFLLLAAAFEELAFRGYAFARAAEAIGPAATICASSVLFGYAHYGNPEATLLSTANTVLAGVLLAVARWRSRGLWMPIALHFAWNFLLGPVFLFPVSGYTFGVAASSPAAGPVWMTGGQYGPEGTAALTAVVAVAIALLSRMPLPVASNQADSGVD